MAQACIPVGSPEKKSRTMARFLHYYSRYVAQMESTALEQKMSENVLSRLSPVIQAAKQYEHLLGHQGQDISFIYAAFTELLECRSFLKYSYAFAFFRYKDHSKEAEKLGFENLLSELEFLTEQLSDIVARQRLRASQYQIMCLTCAAADKRREFSNFMLTIHHTMKQDNARKKNSLLEINSDDEDLWSTLPTEASAEEWVMLLERTRSLSAAVLDASHQVDNVIAAAQRVDHSQNNHNQRHYRNLNRRRRRHRPRVNDPNDVWSQVFSSDDDDDEEEIPSLTTRRADDSDDEQELLEDAELRRAMFESLQMSSQMSHSSDSSDNEDFNEWECNRCTYVNVERGRRCAMCGTPHDRVE